jgi:hypothetical protein
VGKEVYGPSFSYSQYSTLNEDKSSIFKVRVI